jgi:hypothetical protein
LELEVFRTGASLKPIQLKVDDHGIPFLSGEAKTDLISSGFEDRNTYFGSITPSPAYDRKNGPNDIALRRTIADKKIPPT